MSSSPLQFDAADRLWQRFGEMFGSRFFESYGPKPSKSWIDACKDLRNDQVKGALNRIRNSGGPHPPSLPEFIALARNIAVQQPHYELEKPPLDVLACHGNRCLYVFLMNKNAGASRPALAAMVAEKDRVIEQYRSVTQEDPTASLEIRDKLMEVFERLYEPRTAAEIADDFAYFQQTGRVR